ncbi:MAG TPA: hypothetical protein VIM20_03850, partial [Candidatus Limnocylindrales bacterium]
MTDPTRPGADDETEPHQTAGWSRADQPDTRSDPFPSSAAAPGVPASSTPPPASASFSPAPEARTEWAHARWADPEPTPERWFETASPVAASSVPAPTRRSNGAGTVLAAALAAAILASGGTVVALTASGALNRPAVLTAAPNSNANSATIKQPVTLDESSAIIDVAAKAGPSVVR